MNFNENTPLKNKINLAQYIDHTLLKPETQKSQIIQLCEEALQYKFFSVCVNSGLISTCKDVLRGSSIKITSVVGFPLGVCDSSVKSFEVTRALQLGAHEIDMVMNLYAAKSGDWTTVEKDIRDVVLAANGHPVKVIIETFLLTDEEKKKACEVSASAGATFVKTCTGFNGGAASLSDIEIMKNAVQGRCQIKASGGVRDYATALQFIEAGVTRIGTSSGVAIINHQSPATNTY